MIQFLKKVFCFYFSVRIIKAILKFIAQVVRILFFNIACIKKTYELLNVCNMILSVYQVCMPFFIFHFFWSELI